MSQLSAQSLIKVLIAQKNRDKSLVLGRFFKTGPGQYGEGDFFLGITVPITRKIAKDFVGLPLSEIKLLIINKYHEVRLAGILVLVANYQKSKNDQEREKIFKFYLTNAQKINNWDLVDLSAPNIVGDFCVRYPENFSVLKKLALSKNLWERRISIIATFSFIKKGSFRETFELSEILLHDTQDLMHKAVGWMLREVGKRVSRKHLEDFLDKNIKRMPRTALRYAIEHFEEGKRKTYLKK